MAPKGNKNAAGNRGRAGMTRPRNAGRTPDLAMRLREIRQLFATYRLRYDQEQITAIRNEIGPLLAEVASAQPSDEEWDGKPL